MMKVEKFCKAVRYYKKYGIRYLLEICAEKGLKLEEKRYKKMFERSLLTFEEKSKQTEKIFQYMPKISIIVPLYKTPEIYLREMIESVCQQTYKNWELCLSDGGGKKSSLKKIVEEYIRQDERIKAIYSPFQLNISENTNRALSLYTGDYVAFLDHDDVLASNALYECVEVLNRYQKVEMIYTDEDKITMNGKKHFQPHFKPDFNKDLLNSTNYICHLLIVSRSVMEQVGCFRSEFDGAQDYDFVFRCTEVTQNIYHIPKVLYHWRMHEESTASNPESKLYAFDAGANAIKAHYDRIGIDNVLVKQTKYLGVYRTQYILKRKPRVSVIIPNKDHVEDLRRCLHSIMACNYPECEIIVIENNSIEEKTFEFYKELEKKKIKIVFWNGEFNYSTINNYGVKFAEGEYILFLNNDTEIINRGCIEELVGCCMRQDVGAVGARLFYQDDTIQHAGVVVGLGGIAGHIFLNTPKDQVGYFARIITQQNYSAVTAACILVKRRIFEEIEGFDERYKVAYNDVDLCLRIREKGYLIVYNPYAELYHFESKTRGKEDSSDKLNRLDKESDLFKRRWNTILKKGDPYFNKNFSKSKMDCRLKCNKN